MLDDACEREVRELGQRIFELAGEESPSIFDSRWWSGKMIEWSIRDERFKTEMFRFVDVFPALATSEDVARHLEEYFCRDGQDFPAVLRWGLRAATAGSVPARAVSAAARKNMEAMARRFIAGSTASEALALLAEMWRDGVAFSVDLLGEATLSEREAVVYRDRYLELLDVLAAAATTWPEREILESAPSMQLPRVNVSVKLTALSSHVDPMDFAGSVERLAEAALPLFVRARALGAFLNLDVEQYVYKDLTYAVFRRLLETPELEGYEHAGIVCQAYLRDAYDDRRARCARGSFWTWCDLSSHQLE